MKKYINKKVLIFIVCILCVNFFSSYAGLTAAQRIALIAFSSTILGTLLFWEFRLSCAFLGTAIILFFGVARLDKFLRLASMEIILFLVGMMILVGFLKEIGLFTWLLQRVIIIKNISAKKLMATLIFTSGIMACLVDEVSSILFMIMVILEISDFFEINPIPFFISSILASILARADTTIECSTQY